MPFDRILESRPCATGDSVTLSTKMIIGYKIIIIAISRPAKSISVLLK